MKFLRTGYLPVVKNKRISRGYSQKSEPKTLRDKPQGYSRFSEEQDLLRVQCLFISAAIKHKATVIDSYEVVVTSKKEYERTHLVQKSLIHLCA